MDIQERLTVEQATERSLVASEHVHRYEFAAELCAGLRVADVGCGVGYGSALLREACPTVTGVDYDSGAIETARSTFERKGLEFVEGDGGEFLRGPLRDRFDAIVMFESLEHFADLNGALKSLKRHAEDGLRLIVSLPNSRAFGEENPYHRTDFGYEEAIEAFSGFTDVIVLYQFLAEGSLIQSTEPGTLTSRTVLEDRSEPEYANHFIACVNFSDRLDSTARTARVELTLAPNFNRHMASLERANRELRQRNAGLARSQVGHADSAAASLVGRLESAQRRLAEFEQRADEQERAEAEQAAHDAWIANLHDQIEWHKQRLAEVEGSRAWRLANFYWSASTRAKSWLRLR